MPDIDPDVAQSVLDEARRAYADAGTALRRAKEVAEAAGIPVEDDTLTTQRINIVEPDGTPRFILTSASRLPGAIARGEEFPHPGRRDLAGMIFYNDEGTETGGLIYAGRQGTADVHLSFDNFEQDQVIVLESHDDGPANRTAMLEFWDRPDWSLYDVEAATRDGDADAFDRTVAEHGGATRRLRLAREPDTSLGLTMSDSQGRPRIVFRVADDDASIRVLDRNGRTVAQLPTPE